MVEPSWPARTTRLVVVFGLAGLLTGCAVVPRSRLEDCHKLSQTLEADKARLNDNLLSLRSQHNDLAQRADDDARRLLAQEDEVKRLRGTVQAYQDEREQLATDYARVKSLLQASANPVSTSMIHRFEVFAKGRPDCEFNPLSGVLTLSSDALFEPGSDQLKPAARPLLKALAASFQDSRAKEIRMLVAGHTDRSPVLQASLQQDEAPASGHLSLDRATRIRDRLAAEAQIDPARIEVAGFESFESVAEELDDASRARNRRIEIHLFGLPPAPGAPAGP
ncbi:OmpA/MotB family protein [Singulisphaera acidiphila]|uniref:Flagellar motor protein n=1 Tax=Singulisphaera acidiphila (strain ATCC BAA-1392 / DSM 18658 / VKM B-2454 / MOB10) TaxID=886293 RepID=L0DF79_SINAD|nr:OmpA family protein [Singulisphaera acidiphila]AGA27468.1 flagellar motor protein [Singulisphaera acidiphila DSM 18658]